LLVNFSIEKEKKERKKEKGRRRRGKKLKLWENTVRKSSNGEMVVE